MVEMVNARHTGTVQSVKSQNPYLHLSWSIGTVLLTCTIMYICHGVCIRDVFVVYNNNNNRLVKGLHRYYTTILVSRLAQI